jgi:hypothetical protein
VFGTPGTVSTTLGTVGNTNYLGWGSPAVELFKGYLANVRITKGVARYTDTFLAEAPFPDIGKSILCLKFSNAGVRDETGKNNIILGGNTKIKATQSKFGGSSIYFDGIAGNVGGITIPAKASNVLGLEDFTVEFWFHPLTGGRIGAIMDTRLLNWGPNGTAGGFCISCYNTTNPCRIGVYYLVTNSYVGLFSSPMPIPNDQWSHIALVRSGTVWRLFINGMMTNQATLVFNITAAVNHTIGRNNYGDEVINGYLEDFRITKGVARYSDTSFNAQAFAPPARSLYDVNLRTLSGNVLSPGGLSNKIRAYEKAAGSLVGETWSDPTTGAFSMTVDGSTEHTIIALDDVKNALVYDRVIPV